MPSPVISWVVTTEEKTRFDSMFLESDIDMDGFVSGPEIKDRFLKTGIHPSVLAHIWYFHLNVTYHFFITQM